MADTDEEQTAAEYHDELLGRIRGLQEQAGVTDEALTEAVGVPKLIKSLTGTRAFSSYELAGIAQHFGVSTMYLITGEQRGLRRVIACNLDDAFPKSD